MKLTRDNFQQLLTPIHKKIATDAYKKVETTYDKVFKVDTTNRKDITIPHMGAFGLWDENTEGNTINEDELNQGDTATFSVKRRDKGYSVTWELVKDDLYNVIKGRGEGGSAQWLGRGLAATLERDAADVLNKGFTNVGYDGTSLFSDAHPLADSANTLDNLLTGALTPANLKAGMTMMRRQVNEANVLIEARAKTLIVGPDLEYTALEITKSTNQAYEQSNTKNVIEGIRPLIWDYINGTNWFLKDPDIENLLWFWREKAFYDSQTLPKTVDFFMFGYTRYALGYSDFRGLVGSTGQ